MTTICGGGTSSAQPGYGEAVYMVPSMVGALLNNIPTAWAVPLAGFIGAVTYNLSNFCANDPPAVPTFTAQDVIDLLNPYNPIAYGAAQDKFQDLVGAYTWYQVCKCDSVSTPSPPSPPPAPSGMPSVNPIGVGPSYPTGQPCASFQVAFQLTSGGGHSANQPRVTLPSGSTNAQLTAQPDRTIVGAGVGGWQLNLQCFNSAGTFLGNAVHVEESNAGSSLTMTAALLSGTTATSLVCSNFSMTVDVNIDAHYDIFCGDPSSGGSVPTPCPTDPFVLGVLEQILALVTIVQRQAVPFAYVAGTAHSGLTGRGSVAVQGLLGAKIEVTSFGTNTGEVLGDPDVLWDAGWINWGNSDGVSPRQYISNAEMLTLPSLAGQYTQLHYSLEPGVTVTITELEREP